jgi:hypothetical protein
MSILGGSLRKIICLRLGWVRRQYLHLPSLAPTQEMLDEYKKNRGDWA